MENSTHAPRSRTSQCNVALSFRSGVVHIHNNNGITAFASLRHYDIFVLFHYATCRHYDIMPPCGSTTLRDIATHSDTLHERHYDTTTTRGAQETDWTEVAVVTHLGKLTELTGLADCCDDPLENTDGTELTVVTRSRELTELAELTVMTHSRKLTEPTEMTSRTVVTHRRKLTELLS